MAWKKDLAKLKQELGKEEVSPGKAAPPPKARPVHPVSGSIEEEDNIFLSAMGLRPKSVAEPAPAPGQEPAPAAIRPKAAPSAAKAEFNSAMGDLKGLKPMPKSLPIEPPKPAAPGSAAAETKAPAAGAEVPADGPAALEPAAPEPAAPGPAAPMPAAPETPARAMEPAPAAPPQAQIQLAAGMAIVVDGSLDLKGHARSDAEERLKERILDGYALGWRTLHVVVGSSPELRQMVLDLLVTPAGRCVARFAQAPIPMGGAQAWILYFRGQITNEN
jgi:DNA-nicking Smr family endonuclease